MQDYINDLITPDIFPYKKDIFEDCEDEKLIKIMDVQKSNISYWSKILEEKKAKNPDWNIWDDIESWGSKKEAEAIYDKAKLTYDYYNQKINCKCCLEDKKVRNMYREPSSSFGRDSGFLLCDYCTFNKSNTRTKCECGRYGCDDSMCLKPDLAFSDDGGYEYLRTLSFTLGVNNE